MVRVIKEKKDDPEDLEYWIDYIFEVGVEHMRAKQYHETNFLEFMDMDIFLFIYGIISASIASTVYLVVK